MHLAHNQCFKTLSQIVSELITDVLNIKNNNVFLR